MWQGIAQMYAEHTALIKGNSVLRQPDAKPQGGRPEGGVRADARAAGTSEATLRKHTKIAPVQ